MNADASRPGAGLYVHVPFCLTRCGYCDFNAYAGLGHLAERYVRALEREADLAAPGWAGERVDSIFLGGGTPTTLSPAALGGLLGHLRGAFDVAPPAEAEVTTEANPDTVDEASLAALLAAGFTRLSMGVQSFDPTVLAALERVHGPASARRAYAAARRAGFANVNLDLIYGAHGETLDSWRRTLDETVALGPEHVSAYALTIEPATPLGRRVDGGVLPSPASSADTTWATGGGGRTSAWARARTRTATAGGGGTSDLLPPTSRPWSAASSPWAATSG